MPWDREIDICVTTWGSWMRTELERHATSEYEYSM